MKGARLAAPALLTLAGCAAEPPVAAAPTPAAADGSSWVLKEFAGGPAPRASLTFEGVRVTGAGPCNGFFGDVVREGDRIAIGPIAATKRACPELEAESAFLGALTDAWRAAIVDGDLVLYGEDGKALMRFSEGL